MERDSSSPENNGAPTAVPHVRPTRADLQAARKKSVPDLIARNLRVVFCGINPGLYTAAIGHHFGRPGNRFWPALYAGGFTPRLFSPYESETLLPLGCGIINIVKRATATADELTTEELVAGAKKVVAKVKKYRPAFLAVVGLGAYRIGFQRPRAAVGLQPEMIGATRVWVLPNPSGLNAHHQPAALAKMFGALREAAEASMIKTR